MERCPYRDKIIWRGVHIEIRLYGEVSILRCVYMKRYLYGGVCSGHVSITGM